MKTITKDNLKALIYGLDENERIFFRRPCDLYGWGVTKQTILNESFLFLADYESGNVDADALAEDYRETDDHFSVIWQRLMSEYDDETLPISIITEEKAKEMNPEIKPFWEKIKMNCFTISQVVEAVQKLGEEGGGVIEVSETKKIQPCSIWIEQIEWHDTPVCLVGGNGYEVSALHPRNVPYVLDCVIGNYLDGDTFSITPNS